MRIAIGTEKGGYVADSDTGKVEGPLFPGWRVTAFGRTPGGAHLAGVSSHWFGTAIHRSHDFSEWTQIEASPSFGETPEVSQIWTLDIVGDRVWAGVAEAGVFWSDDDGTSWNPVPGLNDHSTRSEWGPGAGGLCAHRILADDARMWVGISAVGVFRSDDGGDVWHLKNDGVDPAGMPDDAPRPEVGYCVHNLDHDPSHPERMWRQDHVGVFRSLDGGDSWQRIEEGLPAGFGFVMRRDHASGRLFVVPLESDGNRVPVGGRFSAFMSDDDGESWRVAGAGWEEAPSYTSVLRGAVDADGRGTLAFGTTGGEVWLTRDGGEKWAKLPSRFPRIGAISLL